MPAWAVALIGIICSVSGAIFGRYTSQGERITLLEERVASLGRQMASLPKRKGD
jgi:hypothetical protein